MIRRSFRIARQSLHTPVPPDEFIASRLEGGVRPWTRREILAAAGVGAAAALTRCASSPSGKSSARKIEEPVLIFGAGSAGLTAAYRLRTAGVPVRVFEASERTGGRILSLRDFFPDAQFCELGGELIDSNHESIRALAGELGLELDDLESDDPSLARELFHFGGKRRKDSEVVAAFRPVAAKVEAALSTLTGEDVTYREKSGGESLDAQSIEQWLTSAGVSGWFRDLLDVGYTTEYGLPIGDQSALNFLMMIEPKAPPFKIYGDSDERYRIRGGNDLLISVLTNQVADAVQNGSLLEAVRLGSDGRIVCSIASKTQGNLELSARHVILAIPFTTLRDVRLDLELSPEKRRAIAELSYGTNAKLMAGFSKRVWREGAKSNGSVLTDKPFQLTWETTRLQKGKSGILTNFTGGAAGLKMGETRPERQAADLAKALDAIFPGASAARGGKQAGFHWPSYRWSRGSYACYRPGQWTAFRGAEAERAGGLHFAGEHCSLDFQGFMEGGVSTGEAAAAEILADLGIARPKERAA
jgi:monoamine oxidase